MIEKIKNTTPRPGTDKAAKFNRDARLVDLNRVIDDVNEEFTAVSQDFIVVTESISELQQAIDDIPPPTPLPTNPTFNSVSDSRGNLRGEESIIDLSTVQILGMGATPVNLLPTPTFSLQYYVIKEIIFEYTPGDTGFISNTISLTGAVNVNIDTTLIDGTSFKYSVYNADVDINNPGVLRAFDLRQGLNITTSDGSNPTDGNGSLKIYVYYDLRRLGV